MRKIMNIILLTPVFFLFQSHVKATEIFIADIYLSGTNNGVLLFNQANNIIKKDNTVLLRHSYSYPDGRLAVKEEVFYENGAFAKYIVEFTDPASKCGCQLKRNEDNVFFSFTKGDTDKKGRAKYYPNLVMGPTLTSFVHENWEQLLQNKKVNFYLPAMSLQRVAEFRLYKNKKSKWARDGVVVIKMDIANAFFRLFVKPVDLVYDLKTRRLLEIHGQSLLRAKVDGKYINPVVDIYYRYEL